MQRCRITVGAQNRLVGRQRVLQGWSTGRTIQLSGLPAGLQDT